MQHQCRMVLKGKSEPSIWHTAYGVKEIFIFGAIQLCLRYLDSTMTFIFGAIQMCLRYLDSTMTLQWATESFNVNLYNTKGTQKEDQYPFLRP